MGIVKRGPSKDWSGKVGNQVYSQHKDRETTVSEAAGPSTVPPTKPQLAQRQIATVCGPALSPLKDFIKVGSLAKGKQKGLSPWNVMVKDARANAIQGEYPNQYLDFSMLRLTQGTMLPPQDASVQLTEEGFAFEWNPDHQRDEDHYTDQVMVMAYFPESGVACYRTSCAERHKGKYVLPLTGVKKGFTAVTYISFITDDRRRISDSVYLGQLNW